MNYRNYGDKLAVIGNVKDIFSIFLCPAIFLHPLHCRNPFPSFHLVDDLIKKYLNPSISNLITIIYLSRTSIRRDCVVLFSIKSEVHWFAATSTADFDAEPTINPRDKHFGSHEFGCKPALRSTYTCNVMIPKDENGIITLNF